MIAPPTPDMKARFGENLERCRERAGLTQTELGYRASLHRTEISLLERGKRLPRIDTAVKLAGCLSVSLDELAAGIGWNPGYTVVVDGGFEVSEPEQP
ncbi:MAG TPA: helix-turn-helix transcriptional regulator [Solirubrobacterales bacterium]|nr:helix-turn-helix transcriptional regulator [Solirubrobacterales bacterium]